MVATGRNPNTEGLGLELAGVELTDRGYIKVNERRRMQAPRNINRGRFGTRMTNGMVRRLHTAGV